jgi:hypothetical protein
VGEVVHLPVTLPLPRPQSLWTIDVRSESNLVPGPETHPMPLPPATDHPGARRKIPASSKPGTKLKGFAPEAGVEIVAAAVTDDLDFRQTGSRPGDCVGGDGAIAGLPPDEHRQMPILG